MLTDAGIQRALKAGRNTQLSDGKGRGTGRLILIIRGTSAEWYAQQWLNGRKRISKIGSYPATSLAEARKRFHSEYAPAIERKADIRFEASQRPGTVRDLFNGYIAHLQANGKRSVVDAEYNLHRLLRAIDADMEANKVTPEHIAFVLRPIYLRGSVSMADHMRGYVQSAFNWAIRSERDYRNNAPKRFFLERNPAADIPSEPKKPGDRWLSVEELREFWLWLHIREPHNPRANHSIRESNQRALRLLIITGQRVEMIAGLNASMLHDGCIDWERTKNGLPHLLPLPSQALPLLVEPNEHGWFFPMDTRPTEHVRDTLLYSITQRFCERTGVKPFAPRDLRRTWKTLAGKAGISKTDRDLIQHHARSDVSSRHYDRYEYMNEKRVAMARWSEWFQSEIADHLPKPTIR